MTEWEGESPVQIWVGLGNPGAQYAMHRHNVGFMAVDAIAETHGFDPAKKAFSGWTRQGRIGGQRILLLKPATFMNDSGRAIRAAMDFFKLAPGEVTAFHDELDLAPFKVKVKVGGGTAGHNGLRSTEAHLGNDFRRVRIGIGHPGHKDKVNKHVLGNYAKAELDPLVDLLGAIAAEAEWLAKGDDARFMSDVALRLQSD
jgi:peptidyl-tRNA hydrolase, PTH1 family